MGHSLFPLDNLEQSLRTFIPALERHDASLKWAAGDGISEILLQPTNYMAPDGLEITEEVILSHTSPGLASLSEVAVAKLNSWATMSSLVPSTPSEAAKLVARVSIFAGDREAAELVYAPLIYMEACISSWHAARLVRGELHCDPDLGPLQMVYQSPPFDDADFQAIKATTDKLGFIGSLGNLYFTVEFPWDPGAVSNLFKQEEFRESAQSFLKVDEDAFYRMAGKTSLLQIRIAEHPLYGKGIHTTLEIPLPADENKSSELVNELNLWELSGPDIPPNFGAWCLGPRAPSYVCFVPTQFCFPGLLHNLTAWMIQRHMHVRRWLLAPPSRQ